MVHGSIRIIKGDIYVLISCTGRWGSQDLCDYIVYLSEMDFDYAMGLYLKNTTEQLKLFKEE